MHGRHFDSLDIPQHMCPHGCLSGGGVVTWKKKERKLTLASKFVLAEAVWVGAYNVFHTRRRHLLLAESAVACLEVLGKLAKEMSHQRNGKRSQEDLFASVASMIRN
jgi:hypothetical protein